MSTAINISIMAAGARSPLFPRREDYNTFHGSGRIDDR